MNHQKKKKIRKAGRKQRLSQACEHFYLLLCSQVLTEQVGHTADGHECGHPPHTPLPTVQEEIISLAKETQCVAHINCFLRDKRLLSSYLTQRAAPMVETPPSTPERPLTADGTSRGGLLCRAGHSILCGTSQTEKNRLQRASSKVKSKTKESSGTLKSHKTRMNRNQSLWTEIELLKMDQTSRANGLSS